MPMLDVLTLTNFLLRRGSARRDDEAKEIEIYGHSKVPLIAACHVIV